MPFLYAKLLARATAALVAAGLTLDAGALPATTPGSLDPLFGDSGVVVHNYADYYDYASILRILPDGRYLVSGYGDSRSLGRGLGYVARYLPDGALDPAFAGDGRRIYGGFTNDMSIYGIAPTADGATVLVGEEYFATPGISEGFITRLRADGSTDTKFGVGGEVRLPAPAPLEILRLRRVEAGPNGTVYATGSAYRKDDTDYRGFVLRLLPDGTPDPSFGAGGFAWLHPLTYEFRGDMIGIDASGRITIAGYTIDTVAWKWNDARAVIIRLNADGTPDATYGTGGLLVYASPLGGTTFNGMHLDPDGSATLLVPITAPANAGAQVVRLTASGQLDAAFGEGGVAMLPPAFITATGLARDPAGRLLVGAVVEGWQASILRLTPSGQVDPTFGTAGYGAGLGYKFSSVFNVAVDADGKIVIVGKVGGGNDDDSVVARMIGTEIVSPVVEFHNTALDHYFVTADPAEAAAIDAGVAGPGWVRTGQSFNSGGPNRVCRFYGNPETNPATGARRGPNSHFYTVEAPECATVKTDAGWKFESYDFNAWPLVAGACPAGTGEVKRAYNGKFAQNDSNHRYLTSEPIYQQMLAAGWTGEGTVFCALP